MRTKNLIALLLFVPIYFLGLITMIKSITRGSNLSLIIILAIICYSIVINLKFNRVTDRTSGYEDLYSEEEWKNEIGFKIITQKTIYRASLIVSTLITISFIIFNIGPKWFSVLIGIVSGLGLPVVYIGIVSMMGVNITTNEAVKDENIKYNSAQSTGIVPKMSYTETSNHTVEEVVDSNSAYFLETLKKILTLEGKKINFDDPDVHSSVITACYAYQAWFIYYFERASNSPEMMNKYKKMLDDVVDKLSSKLFEISGSDFIAENHFRVFDHYMSHWIENCALGDEYTGPLDRNYIDGAFVWDLLYSIGFDIHELAGVIPSDELLREYGVLPPFENPMSFIEIKKAARLQITSLLEYMQKVS